MPMPMPTVQPLNQLLKIVVSVIGASVVTTLYKMSKCETRDKERVCSIER
jgi:hypothetical protein